jgi:hypothetical protein
MARYWSVDCKSCGATIGLEPYAEAGQLGVQWHQSDTIRCPDPTCDEEFQYSGSDFQVADGPLTNI